VALQFNAFAGAGRHMHFCFLLQSHPVAEWADGHRLIRKYTCPGGVTSQRTRPGGHLPITQMSARVVVFLGYDSIQMSARVVIN